MELTIDNASAKALLREVVIELMQERRELFSDLIKEAIEDIGLAEAIREGRQNALVDESEIEAILGQRTGESSI